MMPTRYTTGYSGPARKSKHDNKPSMLPVRRQGSTDRTSTDRRPSTTTMRSSSAEPARGTIGGAHASRDASATKMPTNARSRSQTGPSTTTPPRSSQYSRPTTTPLHSGQYPRPTTTPLRTPDDRNSRSWEASLERALAFVTVKDQRQISNVAWQRAEYARVCAALGARGLPGATLVRPLTIARFVDIVSELLIAIIGEVKLSTDNYVTKLPHMVKRLLYPGTVSKSWLKTVNTLHAFPHALALIGYLLDVATHCHLPVSEDLLYAGKDELSRLRRDYLSKCWARFQVPTGDYKDLNEEYINSLKAILGDDEEKILLLEQDIKKYQRHLENEEEMAARADEARRVERRDALAAALRTDRGTRRALEAELEALAAARQDRAEALRQLDVEIERASAENEQLRAELEQQTMSVEERTRLLEKVDYATRVNDSDQAVAEQISKAVQSKETELALWQKRTLDSCTEYKQGLIQLHARLPALAGLAVDEKELMSAQCAAHMARAVEALRAEGERLAARKHELLRTKSALSRKRAVLLDETRSKIADMKSSIQREQHALKTELNKESSDAAAWSHEQLEVSSRLEQLRANQEDYAKVDAELRFWQTQADAWQAKLSAMRAYTEAQAREAQRITGEARARHAQHVRELLQQWRRQLDR